MLAKTLAVLSLLAQVVVAANSSSPYVNPAQNGGQQLTLQKEPLNVIVSGESDAYALTSDGFESFYRAIGFDVGSCAGRSANDTQRANLGDGNGNVVQAGIARWGNGCIESLTGGNHFRYWVQNGTRANTGAIFIAASVEEPIRQNHMIVSNGYDLGRDWLVGNATQGARTDNKTGNEFTTSVVANNTSLLRGVSASSLNHDIGTDGVVRILRVRVTQGSGNSQQSSENAQTGLASYLPGAATVGSALLAALVPMLVAA
ncbi:hypothetical protein GLX27_002871 [Malassezia furfur]|uniref:Uncharacterized protein n=1 Tax=Malassezia furfur TaxID=55194 RepID=A0ABY8ERP2_MALFU|nr:hypothetical protein CBS14141_002525 [Malassezia furfur]WFD48203.1 hypothetical protein GLX27_002871 [Malassezia furfur]